MTSRSNPPLWATTVVLLSPGLVVAWVFVLGVLGSSCSGSQLEERLQTVRTGIRDTGNGLVRGRALIKAMCEPLPLPDGTPAPAPKECPELYEVFDAIQSGYKLANDNVP